MSKLSQGLIFAGYLVWSFLFAGRCFALDHSGNWLFIGDSHSVRGFGDGVRETLLQAEPALEAKFHQFSVSGSTAAHWMDGSLRQLPINCARKVPGTPKDVIAGIAPEDFRSFPQLLKDIKPTHVIVALGTNDSSHCSRECKDLSLPIQGKSAEKDRVFESNLDSMRQMLNASPAAKCALILPPKLKYKKIPASLHDEFTDALVGIATKRGCLIVDSRLIRDPGTNTQVKSWSDCLISSKKGKAKVLYPDQKDGVHFFHTKGEYWGRCASLLILESWK